MSRDDEAPTAIAAIGRLLQVCVYAPIGAGAKLIDDAPDALARARQELSNARFIGRMVVSRGEAQLRERLASEPATEDPIASSDPTEAAEVREDEPDLLEVAPDPRSDDAPLDGDAAPDTIPPDTVEPHGASALAVPDYDHLPAIDIIAQLDSLDDDELEMIETYERAHRRRRTVLGKIDRLRAAS